MPVSCLCVIAILYVCPVVSMRVCFSFFLFYYMYMFFFVQAGLD